MSVESRGFESQNNSFIEHRNHLFQGNMDDDPVVVFKYFWNFHPDLWGETIQFEHIFQWGWLNHQLDDFSGPFLRELHHTSHCSGQAMCRSISKVIGRKPTPHGQSAANAVPCLEIC